MTQDELDFTTHPDKKIGKGQAKEILNSLQDGHTLTATSALHLHGCFRLAARIKDIRYAGYEVKDSWRELNSGKRVKEYWMEEGS